MGGRIDDIAVVESNPSIIYIGYATGGIWKTTNNGTTWTAIFDTYQYVGGRGKGYETWLKAQEAKAVGEMPPITAEQATRKKKK